MPMHATTAWPPCPCMSPCPTPPKVNTVFFIAIRSLVCMLAALLQCSQSPLALALPDSAPVSPLTCVVAICRQQPSVFDQPLQTSALCWPCAALCRSVHAPPPSLSCCCGGLRAGWHERVRAAAGVGSERMAWAWMTMHGGSQRRCPALLPRFKRCCALAHLPHCSPAALHPCSPRIYPAAALSSPLTCRRLLCVSICRLSQPLTDGSAMLADSARPAGRRPPGLCSCCWLIT